MSAPSLPAAKTPRLEGAALHLLPAVRHRRSRPHPSARATPWDSRAARSFASAHAACTRPRGNGDSRCAAVQQELHSERQPAPAAVHRKTPLAGSPRRSDPCDPLARPFCRTALGRRSVHPQRAAPCTVHCTPLVQDLHRHTAPAPPRPLATPSLSHKPVRIPQLRLISLRSRRTLATGARAADTSPPLLFRYTRAALRRCQGHWP